MPLHRAHHFLEQRENEQILLWVEKHWIKYIRVLGIFIFMGIIPGLAIYLVSMFAFQNKFFLALMMLFILTYELFILLYSYIHLMLDELDLFVVTDQRIVDITQENLFHRKVADAALESVQDATAESKGFEATILDYGDIAVQTAGKKSEFMMDLVPHPFSTSKKILEIVARYKGEGLNGTLADND